MTAIKVQTSLTDIEPVTVQVLTQDGDLWECNHAGAERQERDFGGLRHSSNGDLDWYDDMQLVLECDKCGAWFDEFNSSWEQS